MKTGILLLAAGQSRRFGSDKRLAVLPNGHTLLHQSVRQAVASGLPVIVCLQTADEALAEQLHLLGAATLLCPEADQGMGATLAYGARQLPDWDNLLIALADMPDTQPATFCKAASMLRPGNICLPTFNGFDGHPVGFSRDYFPSLAALCGDTGARDLLQQNKDKVTRFPVDDPGILRDIDRPSDLQ